MIYKLGLLLFFIGTIGYLVNRKSILFMLIALEIMLLGIAFLLIYLSLSFNDLLSLNYALYVLVLAGAEAATGLGLFLSYYKRRGDLSVNNPLY
jgi:NADH:ubiquinone oxidoreductase subunit K